MRHFPDEKAVSAKSLGASDVDMGAVGYITASRYPPTVPVLSPFYLFRKYQLHSPFC